MLLHFKMENVYSDSDAMAWLRGNNNKFQCKVFKKFKSLVDLKNRKYTLCYSQTLATMISSVARGGGAGGLESPPLACEVCKIARFWWF